MVESPAGYRWSSHPANGLGRDDPLLTPHAEYLALGEEPAKRCRSYLGLFDSGKDELLTSAFREATGGGYPLVGDALKARLAAAGVRLERGKPGPRQEKAKEEIEAQPELSTAE